MVFIGTFRITETKRYGVFLAETSTKGQGDRYGEVVCRPIYLFRTVDNGNILHVLSGMGISISLKTYKER